MVYGHSLCGYRIEKKNNDKKTEDNVTFISLKRKRLVYNNMECELLQMVDVTA